MPSGLLLCTWGAAILSQREAAACPHRSPGAGECSSHTPVAGRVGPKPRDPLSVLVGDIPGGRTERRDRASYPSAILAPYIAFLEKF
ncbi:hypothetical protein NDU88_006137 [Pleurodeles waltl]|uniref:Secreted protein n=1 Tax=Pleurodeles waltl TaxID=8319 RepID=A0AAV7WD31_PLEWA|nr:hypothetical protein NDU88_006137 [Pleurodeles waltl]